jgi:hypothetical protein
MSHSRMPPHPHFCACCSVLTWEAVPCPELQGHTCKECAVLLLDAEVRLSFEGIEGCAKEAAS